MCGVLSVMSGSFLFRRGRHLFSFGDSLRPDTSKLNFLKLKGGRNNVSKSGDGLYKHEESLPFNYRSCRGRIKVLRRSMSPFCGGRDIQEWLTGDSGGNFLSPSEERTRKRDYVEYHSSPESSILTYLRNRPHGVASQCLFYKVLKKKFEADENRMTVEPRNYSMGGMDDRESLLNQEK